MAIYSLMVGDQASPLHPLGGKARPLPLTPTEGTIIDASELPSPVAPTSATSDRRRGRPRAHIKEFGEGRVCGSPGCETILSRYNCEGLCWGHDQSARAARITA
jgi:hypothetical protein